MTAYSLEGIRVLDFSRVLAGPLCTMTLGDLGAEVIKVERPIYGDETRQWGPPWVTEGISAYFASVNRNKKSITLNLKSQEGRDIARQLAVHSQIVIENFKVGEMAAFGLDYESLWQFNPGLVYCSITGYGQKGPYSQRAGYDYVIQALSGLMSITGSADGQPYKVGVAISDVITGLYAVSAILAALRHSERTGEGQFVDVSLLNSQIAALVNVASNYLVSGEPPSRYGNEHPNIVPYQTFEASDGQFVVAVGNDSQFHKLCAVLGRDDLCNDERFATNPARVKYRRVLIPLLEAEFIKNSVDFWTTELIEVGIPAGRINDIPTILADEHIYAQNLVSETMIDENVFRYIRYPVNLSGTSARLRLSPPQLGAHTEDVLESLLNFDHDKIARLRNMGVV